MVFSKWVVVALAAFTLLLASCAHKPAPRVAPPSTRLPYLDLQPGWRLAIVSPLDGQTPLAATEESQQVVEQQTLAGASRALTIEAKAPDDFGYLQAWVPLRSARNGVTFRPGQAQRVQGGTTASVDMPAGLRALFPPRGGAARMLFLTREAAVDHDMAILQAETPDALDALTAAVLNDPKAQCRVTKSSWCAWVPRGVAIRVEKSGTPAGDGTWVPVL